MFQILNILFLWLLCFPLYAHPKDGEQKLSVVSDSSVYDYKSGLKTYEGNVQVNQGSTNVAADKLVTKTDAKHKIEEVIAYGIQKPAEYSTLPKNDEPLFRAKAKTIKYNPTTMIVTLEGNVMITQGENSFKGPLIIYNMKEQTVVAPASTSGRATVVIDPKQFE